MFERKDRWDELIREDRWKELVRAIEAETRITKAMGDSR